MRHRIVQNRYEYYDSMRDRTLTQEEIRQMPLQVAREYLRWSKMMRNKKNIGKLSRHIDTFETAISSAQRSLVGAKKRKVEIVRR